MTLNDKKIIASAYFDGALDQEERAWFEEELQAEPSLREHLAGLDQLRDTLRSAPLLAETPDTQTAWIAFIQKTRHITRPARAPVAWRPIFSPVLAGAFALALMAFLVWIARPDPALDRGTSPGLSLVSATGATIEDVVGENLVATSFQSGRTAVIWISDLEPADPESLWK